MTRFIHADTKKRFESDMKILFDGLKELNDRLAIRDYDYTGIPEIAIPHLLEWDLAHNRVGWVYFENPRDELDCDFRRVRVEMQVCLDENDEPIIVIFWAY